MIPIRLRALFVSVLSLSTCGAMATPTLDAAIRERAETLVRNGQHASLLIAVIDSKDSAVYGFGRARDNDSYKPDADTIYELGFVSKTFTALLLADAVVTGKVRLEQPVSELLPGYTIPEFGAQKITLRSLATHFSGLPVMPDNLHSANPLDPFTDYDEAQLRTFLAGYALTRKPGTEFEFSMLGYGLLGTALGTQAKMSYEDLLRARITGPLDMPSTTTIPSPEMRERMAHGHLDNGVPVPIWDFRALEGAGAVLSSGRDMIRYLQSYMRPAGEAQKLALRPQQVLGGEGHDPRAKTLGLAWTLERVNGKNYAWHNGLSGGYTSFVGFSLDGKRGVVVMSGTSREVQSLGQAVLWQSQLPPLPLPASIPPEIAVAPADLVQYAGRYALGASVILNVRQGPDGLLADILESGTTEPREALMFASAQDTFFSRMTGGHPVFQRDAEGTIIGLVLHQHGIAKFARRQF